MFKFLTIFSVVALLSLSVGADARAQDKADLIERYLDVTKFEQQFLKAAMGTGMQPLEASIDTNMSQLPQSVKDEVLEASRTFMANYFQGKLPEIGNLARQLTNEFYTAEELEAAISFFSTPLGASILEKQPKVLTSMSSKLPALIADVEPKVRNDLTPRIRSIIERHLNSQ